MSSATGASPYCIPCEKKTHWIEVQVRDEFNKPFQGVSGVLIDGACNEYPITLGDSPILVEDICPGEVTLKLDSKSWLIESQGKERKPNSEGNPTKDFADEYQGYKDSKPIFFEVTAGDLTELTEEQTLPTRHQQGKADTLKLVADKSYVLKVKGFNFITLRVGMFFDGTANNSYSAQWGKKQLEKYQPKWRQIYDADCQAISEKTGYRKNNVPVTELSDECFSFPEEENFLVKLFTGNDGETETVEGSATNEITNVQKLYDLYVRGKFNSDRTVYSHAEYITGIGTGDSKAIEPADESLLGQGTGIGEYGVTAKVATGIEQLSESVSDISGDIYDLCDGIGKLQFDVFGFSRGAAAARHFINVVLDSERGEFAQSFKKACRENNLPLKASFCWEDALEETASCEISFCGLFDTVASIVHLVSLDSNTLLDFDFSTHTDQGDVRLWLDPNRVRRVVHLTADPTVECRYNFSLNRINTANHYREFVLPGAHSDIGGGYQSRLSYENNNYLLPLLEKKRIKKVSRSFSNGWEKERATKYVLSKLEESCRLDQLSGWNPENYTSPKLTYRRMSDGKQRVTGSIYIKRIVEGELSRLYLRLMYGLAAFHGVPLEKDEYSIWTTGKNYSVGDSNKEFKKLNETVLEYAKLGKYNELTDLLSTSERRKEFMDLNLFHHSSDDSMAFKPLYNEKHGCYMRESYDCEKGK